jgi:hypothetical protein
MHKGIYSDARQGNRTAPDSVYIGKVIMNLPSPINSTDKPTSPGNYLLRSAMVSSCLALMACTMLTPTPQNHAANYIDPKTSPTHQTANDAAPAYSWFY